SERVLLRDDTAHPASFYLSFNYQNSLKERTRAVKERYAELYPRGLPNLHDVYYLLEDATDWMTSQFIQFPQPYLAYIHLLPPHQPYNPRREFIDIFKGDGFRPTSKPVHPSSDGIKEKQLRAIRLKYDEFLAFADFEFGRLYDALEESGVLEDTILVLTSDHGEMFERGIRGHVTPTLYEPIARVPLMISRPGQRARQDVNTPTSCVDLLPTLLHHLDQSIPDWCEGFVLPTFGEDLANTERSIYLVEAKTNPKHGPLQKGTFALIKYPYKLIHYRGYQDIPDGDELFNLDNDPEELENLISSRPQIASEMQNELDSKLDKVNQPYRRQ
ncbi:MAG: sulfatase-like hydrolase/transferase, partial [Anaerolineales bacterium]